MDEAKLEAILTDIMGIIAAQNKHIENLQTQMRLTVQRLAVMEKSLQALETEAARVRKEMTDHLIPHYVANREIFDNAHDIERLLWLLPKDQRGLLKTPDDTLPPIHKRFGA